MAILFLNNIYSQFSSKEIINGYVNQPHLIATADFDNDGDMDLVVASDMQRGVEWFENTDGLGTVSLPKYISEITDVRGIYCSDLDSDSDIDIIIIQNYTIIWFKNDGQGNFSSEEIITDEIINGVQCFITDIDGDNDNDILSASANDNKIAWYENTDGLGTFGPQQIICDTSSFANIVFAADIDNDGDNDVITLLNDTTLCWYENNNASFQQYNIISDTINIRNIDVGDINNDGSIDIVLAGINTFFWFENDGLGDFFTTEIINPIPSFSAKNIKLADTDNDGDLDIFTSTSTKTSLFENTGGGTNTWTEQVINSYLNETYNFDIADIDGDSDNDLLCTSYTDDRLLWNENINNDFSTSHQFLESVYQPWFVSAADLDGDGKKDIIYSEGSSLRRKVSWVKNINNKFDGTNIITNIVDTAFYCNGVDINNNGINDVVVAGNSKIYWFENDGNANFNANLIYSAPQIKFASTIYVNNDNFIDIIFIKDTLIYWLKNDGTGNFNSEILIPNSAGGIPNDVSVADIDGDNDNDLVIGYKQKVIWLENTDGNETFGSEKIINNQMSANFTLVKTADLDNDDNIDIVASLFGENKIVWFKNTDGLGTFSNMLLVDSGIVSGNNIEVADIDGDNIIDIVSSSLSGSISWCRNNGAGTSFNHAHIDDICLGLSLFVNDVDNNGSPDILSSSLCDKNIFWYKNFFNSQFKLTGNTFYDENQNGTKDVSENGLGNRNLILAPISLQAFSDENGDYVICSDSGNYTLAYTTFDHWNLTSNLSEYNVNLTTQNPVIQNLDFGFFPDTAFCNINTELIPGLGLCGDTSIYWVYWQNIGTTTPSGVIELILDTQITFVSCDIAPDSIVGQNYYWHFDTLNFFESSILPIQIILPDYNSIGNILTSNLNIYPDLSQTVFSNTLSYIVECSYDPNDKLVTPKGEGANGIISKDETLKFTVRFQNTGNAEAINIKIRDQLDDNIDIHSLKILASSHNAHKYIEQNNFLVFQFDSILLPDTATSFIKSQGFVIYSVKLNDNVLPNTIIHNTASIFFDNNPAVVTNTTINTVECYITPTAPVIYLSENNLVVNTNNNVQWYLNDYIIFGATDSIYPQAEHGNYTVEVFDDNGCSSFSDVFLFTDIEKTNNSEKVKIYPNPTTGLINIDGDNIKQIDILNIEGKHIYSTNEQIIDISKQPKGIYFVKVTTGRAVIIRKIILE